MDIDHISHSQLSMWQRCPKQWEFRYVEGLKMPPSGALILGSSYHTALEVNFSQKIKSGVDLPTDVVLDAFADAWQDNIEDNDTIAWDGEPGRILDKGAELVRRYQEDIAPGVSPISVETEIIKIISGIPCVFRIDLEKQNGTVVDHKTSARMYSQENSDKDPQFGAYAFASGRPCHCEYHIAVKTKDPKIQIIHTDRTALDIAWWLSLATGILAHMQTGLAPPNSNGWWCSLKYCGYWDKCKGKR